MTKPDLQQKKYIQKAASAKGPYGDTPPLPPNPTLIRINITGDTDPNLPSRILDILTVGGDLPLKFSFCRDEKLETVEVQFELHADEVPFSELLISRILKIPTVISALRVN